MKVNLEDVKAIIERHLDWHVANEDAAKRRILAELDKLADPKENAARDRVKAHLAPFSVGAGVRLGAGAVEVKP